jgi:mRNA-degrading endonuclease toxin of MazEF toxin-antitoxin module
VLGLLVDRGLLSPEWAERILSWRHTGFNALAIRRAGRAAEIAVDQIRTVSKARLGSGIGSLSEAEAAALRRLITEMYGE